MADLKLAIDIVAADLASKAILGVTSNIGGLGTAALAAGAAVAGGLLAIGAASVQAAAESQKIAVQTDAVIASTKGVAGQTAKSVSDLASSLSKVIPIDDEVIQGAENMLLTFTNIGKDVFPQATETVLNMATALGTDANGAAIQLGKALNDPIKGISALQRVGVSFTAAQKDSIKAMVAAGDTAGAQRLILAELGTEFGNSGRAAGQTFAGQLTILQTQLGNVEEAIGGALIPVLSDLLAAVGPVVNDFADALPGAIDTVMAAAKPLVTIIGRDLGAAFTTVKALVAAFTADAGAMGIVIAQIRRVFGDTVADALDPFVNAFMQAIPSIKEFAASVPGLLSRAGDTIKRVWGALQPVIAPLLTYFKQLAPILKDVAGAVVGLVGGKLSLGQFLGRLFGDVKGIGASLAQLLGTWGAMLVGFLKAHAPGWIAAAVQWVKDAIPPLLAQLQAWLGALAAWIDGTGLPWLRAHLAAWGAVLWGWVQAAVPPLLDRLGTLLSAVGDWLVQTGVPALATKLGEWSLAFVGWVADALPPLLDALGKLIVGVLDSIGTSSSDMSESTGSKWVAAFVDWVETKAIPGLAIALPKILVAIVTFIGTVEIAAVEALGRLAVKFYSWVLTDVLPKLPGELAKINAALADWLLNTALPWAETEVLKLGTQLVQSIKTGAETFWTNTAEPWFKSLPGKVTTAVGDLTTLLTSAGTDALTSLKNGMSSGVDTLLTWIKENITNKIPDFIKDLLGIHSPSQVMFGIGANIMAGLTSGMQSKLGDVDQVVGKLTAKIGGMFASGDLNTLGSGALGIAAQHMGAPYVFGAAVGRQDAFDCSSLVAFSYGQEGIGLPRTAQGQYDATQRIPMDQALPGDLVFFTGTYDAGVPVTHVALWMGNGQFLGAQGANVNIGSLASPFWASHLYGFGRVGGAQVAAEAAVTALASDGQPRAFALGGWITEPVYGVGLHSGRGYTLGEREAEYVTPRSHMGGGGGGIQQHFHAPVYIQPRTAMDSYGELALLVDR